jgi:hypothetical protein
MTCDRCGHALQLGEWPFCPHGFPLVGLSIVDDAIDGGPRHFETMGHDAPFIETKSQWKREVEARGLRNVVRHEQAFYDRKRRRRDEEHRDTGTNREY